MRDGNVHKSNRSLYRGVEGGRFFMVKEMTYVQLTNDVFDLPEQAPSVPEGGLSMLQRMINGSERYAYTRHS